MAKRKYIYGRKKTCSRCDNLLEETRIGSCRYCKSCHNASMRKNRKKHSQLTDDERKKANCRSYLNVYIRRGKIIKKPCSVCGDKNSQAHHEDYNKPLEVIWYCRKHHLEYHKLNDNPFRWFTHGDVPKPIITH